LEKDPAWEEFCLLQNSWLTIWQSYMRWFSWHFGIHIGALAVVLVSVSLRTHAVYAAAFMAIFGLLGLIAAVCMWIYDASVRNRADILMSNLEGRQAILGGAILKFARLGTVTTNLLLISAWGYVASAPPAVDAASALPTLPGLSAPR